MGRLVNCTRCGHSPDDHRLDDSLNMSPTDPAAPFRCVVHIFDESSECRCPDYVGEVAS